MKYSGEKCIDIIILKLYILLYIHLYILYTTVCYVTENHLILTAKSSNSTGYLKYYSYVRLPGNHQTCENLRNRRFFQSQVGGLKKKTGFFSAAFFRGCKSIPSGKLT